MHFSHAFRQGKSAIQCDTIHGFNIRAWQINGQHIHLNKLPIVVSTARIIYLLSVCKRSPIFGLCCLTPSLLLVDPPSPAICIHRTAEENWQLSIGILLRIRNVADLQPGPLIPSSCVKSVFAPLNCYDQLLLTADIYSSM